MNIKFNSLLFLVFLFSFVKINSQSRTKVNFGSDWEFKRDEPNSNWEKITIPHTAKIEPLVVNNQFQGRSKDEYSAEFTTLLNRSIAYAGNRRNRVFVLSIPDYAVTPFAINRDTAYISQQINEFNAINKTITTAAGVTYIDITPISREGRTNQSLHALDGLHPSGIQYGRWAALLAPLMKQAL